MDIMRPPLEQQVSPAPWLVARNRVDMPALIRKSLRQHPTAKVDDIVRQLGDWGVQVSGTVVAMWMIKLRKFKAAERQADDRPSPVETPPMQHETEKAHRQQFESAKTT